MSDITANRHRGNIESQEAFRQSSPVHQNDRDECLLCITTQDCTSKEIAAAMERPLNCLSGRLSELKKMGLIRATSVRRDGCAVLERIWQKPVQLNLVEVA